MFDNTAARERLSYFLKTSLSFQYYLLISPFRVNTIQSDNRQGSQRVLYQTQSWLPQKCICFVLTCLNAPWILYTIRSSIPSNPKNPAGYLTMGAYIIAAFFQLGFNKKNWMEQAKIIKILNFLLDTNKDLPILDSENFVMKTRAKVAMIFFCIMHAILALIYWTLRKSQISFPVEFLNNGEKLPWNLRWLWATGVLFGRDMFFVANSSTNTAIISEWILAKSSQYPFTNLDAIVAVLASASQYFVLMLNLQCDLQLLAIASTLWFVAKQLGTEVGRYCSMSDFIKDGAPTTNLVQLSQRLTWDEVQIMYDTTRELATLINQTYGWHFGLYLACYILFNSITIDEIFIPGVFPDFWQIAGLMGYIILLCLVIFMCVDTCSQVRYRSYLDNFIMSTTCKLYFWKFKCNLYRWIS